MDTALHRCACRLACYTVAMAATLGAPAALQAGILLRPDLLSAEDVATAMSFALAAAVVVFPTLLRALISQGD